MSRPSGGDRRPVFSAPTRNLSFLAAGSCAGRAFYLRYPAVRETKGEAAMFEMLNEEKHDSESRKLFWMKVGIFVIAVAAMGGVIYMSFYFTT